MTMSNAEQQIRTNAVPLVSIVIPAYNCEAFIAETLNSCLAQTYPNIEIIVVNDGATDGTAAVLTSYGDKIHLIDQTNSGVAAARNTGQRAARGQFVAWMDCDDIADPQRIALEAAVLIQFPEVALVSTDFSAFVTGKPDHEQSHIGTYYGSFRARGGAERLFARSIEIISPETNCSHTVWLGNQFENLIWGNFVHPPTVMARKALLDEVGPCDTTLRSGSDYECILRLSRTGEFALIDTPLLRYRRSDQQLSASFSKGETWSEYRRILAKFKELEPGVFQRHRSVYSRTLARTYIYEAKSLGNKSRLTALWLLVLSLSIAFLPFEFADALIFILVPGFVITLAKGYRRWRRQHRQKSQHA